MKNLSRVSLVLLSSVMLLALPACGKSGAPQDKNSQRKLKVKIGDAAPAGEVTANVAEFDPNAAISLDMDSYGGERPDDYEVQQAFYGAFDGIGSCVLAERERQKVADDDVLPGDVTMAVKLNPTRGRPFGVNATMPEGFEDNEKLTDCMREEVGKVEYPKYDGPPVVVEFEFELDPGSVWVEE